ncbi:MAG TPA: T9SS type A sorting domain-containing protein, partial [Bacteroidota bacterium]|nr:T9SS type A sorting domain-containing protein [Bacteroidota bacterium]
SSSLWDGNDQCKPAFYEVANVGINYNALDSIISYARTIQRGAYNAPSWTAFQTALASAVTARDQNYSITLAADATLGNAKTALSTAISGLSTVVSAVGSEQNQIAGDFALLQNYPNPFNPSTAINYQLTATGVVRLKIFDALGKEVATLVDGMQPAGSHTVVWNAQNLPSGVYVCRLVSGAYVGTKKMVLMK